MSDHVVTGGQGWGIRHRAEPGAPTPGAGGDQPGPRFALVPIGAAPPVAPASVPSATALNEGSWVAGAGWVAGDHPSAGKARHRGGPRRKRGLLGIGPSSFVGLVVLRVGISATLGLVLFSMFGWHSWITNIFHKSHEVSTPPSIAGDPLITTGSIGALSRQANAYFAGQSIVKGFGGGYYAPPGATTPAYGVFAFTHSGASLTSSKMSDIVSEIAGGSYAGTVKTDTRDGVTYTCGNVAVGSSVGVGCIFDDYDVAGFLVNFASNDVDSTMVLAQMARSALENPQPSTASTATSS